MSVCDYRPSVLAHFFFRILSPLEQDDRQRPTQNQAHIGQTTLRHDTESTEADSGNDGGGAHILRPGLGAVQQKGRKDQVLGENRVQQTGAVRLNHEEKQLLNGDVE